MENLNHFTISSSQAREIIRAERQSNLERKVSSIIQTYELDTLEGYRLAKDKLSVRVLINDFEVWLNFHKSGDTFTIAIIKDPRIESISYFLDVKPKAGYCKLAPEFVIATMPEEWYEQSKANKKDAVRFNTTYVRDILLAIYNPLWSAIDPKENPELKRKERLLKKIAKEFGYEIISIELEPVKGL